MLDRCNKIDTYRAEESQVVAEKDCKASEFYISVSFGGRNFFGQAKITSGGYKGLSRDKEMIDGAAHLSALRYVRLTSTLCPGGPFWADVLEGLRRRHRAQINTILKILVGILPPRGYTEDSGDVVPIKMLAEKTNRSRKKRECIQACLAVKRQDGALFGSKERCEEGFPV